MLPLGPSILIAVIRAVLILLSGSAWFRFSGLNRDATGLERVVLYTCLGIATAILIGSFLAVAHFPFSLAEISMISFAALLVLLSLRTRPGISIRKLTLSSYSPYWLPAVLFLLHLTLWASYLNTYPYFSNTDPPDVLLHWQITNSILAGINAGPVSAAGFTDGAHILFAFIASYFQVGVLTAMRITAAFVESFSVLVAYCVFHRLLASRVAADYASVAYAVIIPAGLVYYARLGAYPNIMGDFFVLTSILLAFLVRKRLTLRSVTTAVLMDGVALVSHVSVVIFALLVIVFSTFVLWAFRSQLRAYCFSNLGFFLIPAIAILAAPFLVRRVFNYVIPLYFQIVTDLPLYTQIWSHNFLFLPGPLNFVLLMAGFLWALVYRRKNLWIIFLVTWFALLNLLVFFATFGERLILLSFVPGAGIIGLMLAQAHEAIHGIVLPKIPGANLRRILFAVMMVGLVAVLAANGPGPFEEAQVLVPGQALMQQHIYDSMVWIGLNTPPSSSVVSVGLLMEYRYLPLVANRTYLGDFPLNASQLLQQRNSLSFSYVAVSTTFSGLASYYRSDALKPAYHNDAVAIFEYY